MKTMIILAVLMFPSTAAAIEWFEPFTKEDWGYQLTYTAITAVDWRQTQIHIKDPTKDERCFTLGNNPSRTKVDLMIGGGIVLHGLISYALPPKARRIWQCVWIGIETDAVEHNYQWGIRIPI